MLGLFHERLAADPDMHVYHYASYETAALKRLAAQHGIREDELDELLRREVFVDLYTVTRQALRISYPSYSIKKVRQFFMDAEAELEGGEDAIVLYEQWIGRARPGDPRADRALQRGGLPLDLLLRDWLLERREEAEAQFGVAIPWRAEPEVREPDEEAVGLAAERAAAPAGPARDAATPRSRSWATCSSTTAARRGPSGGGSSRAAKMTPEQLVEDSEAIGCLEPDGTAPEEDGQVAASTASASRCSSRSSTRATGSTTP